MTGSVCFAVTVHFFFIGSEQLKLENGRTSCSLSAGSTSVGSTVPVHVILVPSAGELQEICGYYSIFRSDISQQGFWEKSPTGYISSIQSRSVSSTVIVKFVLTHTSKDTNKKVGLLTIL